LKLDLHDRYSHHPLVAFNDLPLHIGRYDVGIAPLADIPANWCRSDIKVKEYAASGVPWLASPRGPYRGLSETQGGRLVSDDRWFEAVDALVSNRWARWRLGRHARSWAQRQTIEAAADQWESVFLHAAAAVSLNARVVPVSQFDATAGSR
jgi:glycosyltransferase involved in cell wall biosynthesis